MAMDNTKRLLNQLQNAAVNLRKVADLMDPEKYTPAQISASRGKALVYETVANDLALALLADKVPLNDTEGK